MSTTQLLKPKTLGRPPKLTLRSAPRSYKPSDEIEHMLQEEMKRTGRTFTQITDAALKAYLIIKR